MRNRLSIVLLFISVFGFAEEPNKLIMGVRNNNFAFIGYEANQNWNVRLENSMFAKQVSSQYARIYGEYRKTWEKIELDAIVEPFVGSNYVGQFYDLGIRLGLEKKLWERLLISADFIPRYDSGKGYISCFTGSAGYFVLDEIALNLKFTNLPEYRNPEKRICAGLVFESGNLKINPEITVPLEGNVRTSRVNISFQYGLILKRD